MTVNSVNFKNFNRNTSANLSVYANCIGSLYSMLMSMQMCCHCAM